MKTIRILLPLFVGLAAFAAEPPSPESIAEAKISYAAGLAHQKEHRLPEAIASFEKATKLDPTKPDHFSALGIALSENMRTLTFVEQGMTAGKLRKAFAKSVELDPNHVSGLIGLARYYANAPAIAGGSLAKAGEFAKRVQALDPFLGALELANIAEQSEDFAAALAQYETAAQLRPKSAGLQVAAGKMLVKLGRQAEARARFEAALVLDPQRDAAKKALAELEKK